MKVLVNNFSSNWTDDVKTKWRPPAGFFKGSAKSIAVGLKRAKGDLKSAMSALNFYINRGGTGLSMEDRRRLELAKRKLRKLYS